MTEVNPFVAQPMNNFTQIPKGTLPGQEHKLLIMQYNTITWLEKLYH